MKIEDITMEKINITSKKSRWVLFILIVILVPILFHQISGQISAYNQREAMKKPVTVQTIHPEIKEIYSVSESAGRIDAKYSVDVVARINGWLQKRFFDEGAEIKKGQTLFLIEPDEYKIAVNNAEAGVKRSQAAYTNAEKELQRAKELVKKDYVSKSYYDDALSLRDQNKAALDSAKAQLENAKLNLSYTKITSPIDGKIGKIIITEGNLVNTQSGPLAKIVSIKPIYVYFTLKSSEFLKLKKSDNSSGLSDMDVKIILADGSTYNERGKIEFVDNTVNETTGTISLRATFENADELLVPGDFVRVVIKATKPQRALMIPQSAALNDANGYYVWSINSENKVERKNIKVADEINKNWVVTEGITTEDVIVGKGIQSIRMPGQTVNPKPLEDSNTAQSK